MSITRNWSLSGNGIICAIVSSQRLAALSKAFSEREGVVFHSTPRFALPITLTAFSDAEELVVFDNRFVTAPRAEFDFLFERVFELFVSFFFIFDFFDCTFQDLLIGLTTAFFSLLLFFDGSNEIFKIDFLPRSRLLEGLVHFVGAYRHCASIIKQSGCGVNFL